MKPNVQPEFFFLIFNVNIIFTDILVLINLFKSTTILATLVLTKIGASRFGQTFTIWITGKFFVSYTYSPILDILKISLTVYWALQ